MEIMETKGMNVDVEGIITYAKGYLVAEGGTTNEGVTINFVMTDNLTPNYNPKDKSMGSRFSKTSIPADKANKLKYVPGYYKLHCEMSVGSDGKPVLKPYDVDILKICDLKLLDLPKEETTPPESGSGKSGSGKTK